MNDDVESVLIRDAETNDMPFFWSSILNHFRHSAYSTRYTQTSIYFWHMQRMINAALDRPGNFVRVASLVDDPDTVIGYVWGNTSPQTIYYAYVKKAFRLMGIAKLIVGKSLHSHKDIFCPFLSFDAARLIQKYPQLVHNPYMMDDATWQTYQQELREGGGDLAKMFLTSQYRQQQN